MRARMIIFVKLTTCIRCYLTILRSSNSSQKMDAAGKSKAVAAVMALSAGGQTNLWDGLVKGLEDLAKQQVTGWFFH